MNHYPHHIGDFNSATRHLTRVERSLYRDLLELYYDTEKPLKNNFEWLARRVLAHSEEEKTALKYVINEFFEAVGDFLHNDRCDIEIQKYHDNNSAKARAGKASAEARKRKLAAKKKQSATKGQQKGTHVEHVLNSVATQGQQNSTNQNQEPEPEPEPILNTQQKGGVEYFERFWNAGMVKTNKKKSQSIFNRILKTKSNPEGFTEQLVLDIQKRLNFGQMGFDKMHPTTYLNGERWNDEIKFGGNHADNRHASKQTPAERAIEQGRIAIARAEAAEREANQTGNSFVGKDESVVSTQMGVWRGPDT